MTSLILAITDAGLAAIEAVAGTSAVTIAELGLSSAPFTPAPTLTALPHEFKRIAAVAGAEAAPNITHMSAYDTSTDAWVATGFGLYLADGTLFATYSSPDVPAIAKASPAFALIAFDIAFDADLAASITFGDPIFTNPPATAETRGLVELATIAEAQAGLDTERAITPAAALAAVLDWIGYTPLDSADFTAAAVLALLLSVDGDGSTLDADLLDGHHAADFQLASAALGIDQAWQDVTGTRASGTVYTNDTGRPIQLLVVFPDTAGGSPHVTVTVGGVTLINNVLYDLDSATGTMIPSFIVPVGATYAVSWTAGAPQWNELR